ncbi:MAG: hypothetical protein JNM72_04385 [Deltaproteobacteria bacterium]|nr:hypothetical protein [Deltaproteobacteria bacterium]
MSQRLKTSQTSRSVAGAIILSACGSPEKPDLDINGFWSLNPIESRYLDQHHFTAFYIDFDASIAASTSFIEIEGLPTSRQGGEAASSSFLRSYGSDCPADWPIGAESRGEVYGTDQPGDNLRWVDTESNLLYMEEGLGNYALYPMTCSFPHPDQMRCIWGWPGGPVGVPELRDTVLVFDRGDSAVRSAPCETLVEAAMHFPYDVWIDP